MRGVRVMTRLGGGDGACMEEVTHTHPCRHLGTLDHVGRTTLGKTDKGGEDRRANKSKRERECDAYALLLLLQKVCIHDYNVRMGSLGGRCTVPRLPAR
jgi:hypothetical protein